MTSRAGALAIAALVLLAGCQRPADEPPAPVASPAAEPAAEVPPFGGGDPSDEEIRAWVEDERYRETWELLPGTAALHAGADPHGALLTTYANPAALEAIERSALSMPPGAAFVVEDHLADTTLSAISVMLRVGDSGPDSEWRFARFAPTGEIEAGPMDACRGCHVLEPDLVFAWELGTPIPVDSTGAAASGPDSVNAP